MANKASSTQPKYLKLEAANKQLLAENKELKQKIKNIDGRKKTGRLARGWRSISVIVLVCLAVVLLTLGNVLFWFGESIVNTDRYIATVTPVIKDPKVQNTLALYTTNQIFNNVDVEGYAEQVLPPRAAFLAPQLTSQLKTRTQSTLQATLASPKFQTIWVNVQTKQHQAIIGFATDYQGNGTINLNDVYSSLSDQLKTTKLSFLADKHLPASVGSITVVSAPWLPTVHRVVTHMDLWRNLTILIMLSSLALAIYLSRNRRRTAYIFGWASVGTLVASLISLRLVREVIAGHVEAQYADGVRSAIEIFLHPLVVQTTSIIIFISLVTFIIWLGGPSAKATGFKKRVSALMSGQLHESLIGSHQNRFVIWTGKHKRLIQELIIGVAVLLMLITRATPKALFVYILGLALALLVVEFVAGTPDKKTLS